jgi:hypothetical protein
VCGFGWGTSLSGFQLFRLPHHPCPYPQRARGDGVSSSVPPCGFPLTGGRCHPHKQVRARYGNELVRVRLDTSRKKKVKRRTSMPEEGEKHTTEREGGRKEGRGQGREGKEHVVCCWTSRRRVAGRGIGKIITCTGDQPVKHAAGCRVRTLSLPTGINPDRAPLPPCGRVAHFP